MWNFRLLVELVICSYSFFLSSHTYVVGHSLYTILCSSFLGEFSFVLSTEWMICGWMKQLGDTSFYYFFHWGFHNIAALILSKDRLFFPPKGRYKLWFRKINYPPCSQAFWAEHLQFCSTGFSYVEGILWSWWKLHIQRPCSTHPQPTNASSWTWKSDESQLCPSMSAPSLGAL